MLYLFLLVAPAPAIENDGRALQAEPRQMVFNNSARSRKYVDTQFYDLKRTDLKPRRRFKTGPLFTCLERDQKSVRMYYGKPTVESSVAFAYEYSLADGSGGHSTSSQQGRDVKFREFDTPKSWADLNIDSGKLLTAHEAMNINQRANIREAYASGGIPRSAYVKAARGQDKFFVADTCAADDCPILNATCEGHTMQQQIEKQGADFDENFTMQVSNIECKPGYKLADGYQKFTGASVTITDWNWLTVDETGFRSRWHMCVPGFKNHCVQIEGKMNFVKTVRCELGTEYCQEDRPKKVCPDTPKDTTTTTTRPQPKSLKSARSNRHRRSISNARSGYSRPNSWWLNWLR